MRHGKSDMLSFTIGENVLLLGNPRLYCRSIFALIARRNNVDCQPIHLASPL